MDSNEFISGIKNIEEIVAVCEFGSYGTKYWVEHRSDIDLAIIVAPNVSFMDTLDIEDDILDLAKKYYNYDDIHLTFILFSDFGCKFARMAIDSKKQYIANENRWFDFQHYVLKYIRNNENLERILKIDEQYSYFGRIVDESIL